MSVLSAAHVVAQHHPSAWGAAIVPALVGLMVAPAAVARAFFAWGGE